MRRLRKVVLGAAIFFAVYTIIGFLVAPPVMKSVLVKKLQERLNREVSIQGIKMNPYILSLGIKGFSVKDRENHDLFLSFDNLYINFQSLSLFKLALIVKEFQLQGVYIKIVRVDDHAFNFSDLIQKPEPEKAEESRFLMFSLNNIEVLNGSVDFLDNPKQVKHSVKGMHLALPFLSNFPYHSEIYVKPFLKAVVNETPVTLKGQTRPFHDTYETAFDIDLKGLDLTRYLPYIPFEMKFDLVRGSADLKAQITYSQIEKKPLLFVSGDLSIRSLETKGKDGKPLITLPLVAVSLARSELISKKIQLSKTLISSPEVHVVRDSNGRVNLADLLPPKKTETFKTNEPDSNKDALSITVDEIDLTDGKVHFTDNLASGPFQTDLEQVNVGINDFSNEEDKRSSMQVSFRTESSEEIRLEGSFSINPLLSEGTVEFKRIPLKKYSPYYKKHVLFTIEKGELEVTSKYGFVQDEKREPREFALSDVSVVLSDLDLKKKDEKESFMTIPILAVKEMLVDVTGKKLAIGSFFTANGFIEVSRSREGIVNLMELVSPSARERHETRPAPTEKPERKAWDVSLSKGLVDQYSVGLYDRMPSSPVSLAMDQIKLKLEGISNSKDSKGKVDLFTRVPPGGSISAKGDLGISPMFAKVRLDLKDLDIRALQPYWMDKVKVTLTKGGVSTSGDVKLRHGGERGVTARFRGEALVSGFSTIDKRHAEDFLKWKSLRLNGMNISYNPTEIGIETVELSDFYSRISIDHEAKANIQDIVERPGPSEKAISKEKPAPKYEAASREKESAPIDIKTIALKGGEINFSDEYIKPNISATLTDVEGRITGLTSKETHVADVNLKGKLDHHSPLEIIGRMNPLRKDFFLDLTVKFTGIDLVPATPYSGKYIGYAIEKGKLSLDLKYLVAKRKLDAQNKILLNQFTLGNPIESSHATKLPVPLAISLLKNREGEINLDLPVTGSLDDPEFSVGKIILQMLLNLLKKALTFPFALLGAVFGGGEELSYLEFSPGSAILDAKNLDKLDKLTKILYERPGLRLELEGHVDTKADKEALIDSFFARKLKAQKLKDMIAKGQPGVPLDAINLEPAEYEKYLTIAYQAETLGTKDERGPKKKLTVQEMEKLLFGRIKVNEDDLRMLAIERANKTKSAILGSGKIDPQRVFLVEPKPLVPEKKEKLKDSRVNFRFK